MRDSLVADLIAIVGSLDSVMGDGPMSVPSYAQVREIAARYPDSRSAVLPALRLAQERDGWLSTARPSRRSPTRST